MFVGYGSFLGLLFMVFLAVLFVGLVVWVIVTLTTSRHPRDLPAPGSSSRVAALSILEERYAKGEIDRDDYLQRRTDLRS